jgi:hypothetical protein
MTQSLGRRFFVAPHLAVARPAFVTLSIVAALCAGSVALAQVDAPDLPQNRVLPPSGPSRSTGPTSTPTAPIKPITRSPLKASPPGESGVNLDQMISHSATGLALPNAPVEADLSLGSDRATSWREGDTHHILLEGNVSIAIGSYAFKSQRAVVFVSPKVLPGLVAKDVVIYLDKVGELGGYGPITQSAERLLVTSVLTGKVELATNSHNVNPEARSNELVKAAHARIDRYRTALAANTISMPKGDPLFPNAVFAERTKRRGEEELPPKPGPAPTTVATAGAPGKPSTEVSQPPTGPQPPTAPTQPQTPTFAGNVDFHAGSVVYQRGDEKQQSHVLLLGGVQVMYSDNAHNRHLTLTADKAVIFLADKDAAATGSTSIEAGKVTGVYLEDNVLVTDGQYTMRGPRVYYDFRTDRAVVMEAVFFTYDIKKQVPLYLRAFELRQNSRTSWSAADAQFTTSEFAEPLFAIGAKTMRVTQETDATAKPTYRFEGDDITMRVADVPIFYWPSATGTTESMPIEAIRVGGYSRRGAYVETRWDAFSLLDQKKIEGVSATWMVDGFSKRGPGVGLDSRYDVPNAFGDLRMYYIHDTGRDEPGGRDSIDPLAENRGRVLWRHHHDLGDGWEASVQLAYDSDPTFLEEWFPGDAYSWPEYESSIYLKQQRDDWAFSFLAKHDLNDFIAQSDLLQTRGTMGVPGYTTDKYPELAYWRVGTPLWDDRLTWYSENRGSSMRLQLPNDSLKDRGFNNAQALAIFGMGSADTTFQNYQKGLGLDERQRFRGDTRQEIDAPMKLGIVDVVPYVVGRVTAYSDDFNDFSGEDDTLRLWGGAGVKLHTSFSQSFDNVESDLFDVHRLRHIIEPSATIQYADTTINQESLPVYDYDVESIAEGATGRFGVRNTLQTQRGGPGNWRSVDFLRLDTNLVLVSGEVQTESPLAHFFDDRPEMNLGNNHVFNDLAWQATDTLKVVADQDYNLDTSENERWDAGIMIDHTPRLTTFVGVREIRPVHSMIISYGFEYTITPKWVVGFTQAFDLREGTSRSVTVHLTRRLPHWLLITMIDFDTIENSTSFGIALAPEGFGGKGSPGRNPFMVR